MRLWYDGGREGWTRDSRLLREEEVEGVESEGVKCASDIVCSDVEGTCVARVLGARAA